MQGYTKKRGFFFSKTAGFCFHTVKESSNELPIICSGSQSTVARQGRELCLVRQIPLHMSI